MDITLWRPGEFKKRENSTKQPTSGTGTRYTGIARNADPFSLLSPSIVFDFSEVPNIGTEAAPPYTYAYVADFSRYYFIDDWTHDRGRWTAHLRADVLASFKAQIADEDLYVLRSSAEYDGYIPDGKYPLESSHSYNSLALPNAISLSGGYSAAPKTYTDVWGKNYEDGYWCVGITSGAPAAQGGANWYIMTMTGFAELCRSINALSIDDMGELLEGIKIAIADPIKWVNKVIWTPFPIPGKVPSDSQTTTLYLGKYSITLHGASYFRPVQAMSHFAYNLTDIPAHPQMSARGRYTASPPYSKYTLRFYPFGDLNIDGTELAGRRLVLSGVYDYSTGMGRLEMTATDDNGNGKAYLGSAAGMMGVPVPMTQAAVDVIGGALGAGSMLVGTATAMMGVATGNYAALGKSAADFGGGIMSTLSAAFPSPKSAGGGGDFMTWSGDNMQRPHLISEFWTIADIYNAEHGRPLCKVRKPKNIPGYIMANNAKIEITGLKSEEEQIEGYMNGGFFYE